MKSYNYYNTTIITKLLQVLFVCLLLQSCNEAVMLCGNPGVGKSTLCNSMIGARRFESGVSNMTGLTTSAQQCSHEGVLYIDTPGLNDSDKENNKKYAKEIERALKLNTNYKLIFVAKLDSGRIRVSDFFTIQKVCEAIDINQLEYGIIFNQISKNVIKKFVTTEDTLEVKKEKLEKKVLAEMNKSEGLVKRPASVLILEYNEDLHDADNVYIQGSGEKNRLLDFIKNLKPNYIKENQVKEIDFRDPEEMKKEIAKLKEEIKKIEGRVSDNKDCCPTQ